MYNKIFIIISLITSPIIFASASHGSQVKSKSENTIKAHASSSPAQPIAQSMGAAAAAIAQPKSPEALTSKAQVPNAPLPCNVPSSSAQSTTQSMRGTAAAAAQPKQSEAQVITPQAPNTPWSYSELLERAAELQKENDALRVALLSKADRLQWIDQQRQHYLVWACRALGIIENEKKAHLLKEVYSNTMDPADIPEWTNELLEDQIKKMWQERTENGDDRYCYPAYYCGKSFINDYCGKSFIDE